MRCVIALALVLLAGCAANPHWQKQSASPAEQVSDYSECNSEAEEANARDNAIDADILASRGHDWQNAGTLAIRKDGYAAENASRTDGVVEFCMRAKGYTEAH